MASLGVENVKAEFLEVAARIAGRHEADPLEFRSHVFSGLPLARVSGASAFVIVVSGP